MSKLERISQIGIWPRADETERALLKADAIIAILPTTEDVRKGALAKTEPGPAEGLLSGLQVRITALIAENAQGLPTIWKNAFRARSPCVAQQVMAEIKDVIAALPTKPDAGEIRRRALEEAAAVVDNALWGSGPAKAIRALAPSPQSPEAHALQSKTAPRAEGAVSISESD